MVGLMDVGQSKSQDENHSGLMQQVLRRRRYPTHMASVVKSTVMLVLDFVQLHLLWVCCHALFCT